MLWHAVDPRPAAGSWASCSAAGPTHLTPDPAFRVCVHVCVCAYVQYSQIKVELQDDVVAQHYSSKLNLAILSLSAEITSEAEELCSKPQEESKSHAPEPENSLCSGLTTDQVRLPKKTLSSPFCVFSIFPFTLPDTT